LFLIIPGKRYKCTLTKVRAAVILISTLAGFFLVENLIFNTPYYPTIVDPDSTTGSLQLSLLNEINREVRDRKQVLGIGDSRMGLFPRYADEMKGLDYTFASIATPGTTPRCWYYMLRDVDPSHRRYAAILIPFEDYDDVETWEDHADRISDLHYLIPLLSWTDLVEFPRSYHSSALKFKSALGILLKGTVYKSDFQELLLHRQARLKYAAQARRDSHNWIYNFKDTDRNVTDVVVDWKTRKIIAPPGTSEGDLNGYRHRLLDPYPDPIGRRSVYLTYWLNKICDLYRGSGTRLIIFRLPRGPYVRSDPPPFDPHSSVRQAATRPEVTLDPEHYFDFLEKPELFKDPFHLNGPGQAQFSRALAQRVNELLGPSKSN
jgi:hypothetical protein